MVLLLLLTAAVLAAGSDTEAGPSSVEPIPEGTFYRDRALNNEEGVPITATPTINVTDIKLIADFPNQILFSQGRRISFDALQMEGSAHIDPGEGLAVYKGGVNEVIDPSFEGSGWKLGPLAKIDTGEASSGRKSLRISGDGSRQVVATLKEPVRIVSGKARTLSFDHKCGQYLGGAIKVSLKVFDSGGNIIGEQAGAIELGRNQWQRTGGFIYQLPDGASAYTVEVFSDGFRGLCHIDAVLVEPKDFFTPYFDGDSDNCLWVGAATPQNLTVDLNRTTPSLLLKGAVMGIIAMAAMGISTVLFVNGFYRGRRHWMVIPPLAAITVAGIVGLSLGVVHIPHVLPRVVTLPGSYLEPDHSYFYRVTAVDEEGRESPPSSEARIRTGWLERKVKLSWDRDINAVKYRIYRGDSSYEQDAVYEVSGDAGGFVDVGLKADWGQPPLELGADTAVPHASRSLRPEPDARISNTRIGLDTLSDFWVTGEIQFNFSSDRPFRPASFFEIGNPYQETQFAVSTRYFPDWGDDVPKILLIKGTGRGDFNYEWQPLPPLHPGSVIRYVAAQLYQPTAGLPAGVHLWYMIDSGNINHITVGNTESLSDWPMIRISKRYYYDEFGNNSICRSFAIVQGKIDESTVYHLMAPPGSIPENLGRMASP